MAVFGLSNLIYRFLKPDEATQFGYIGFFTCIAIVMYLYRRNQRINMDRAKAEDTADKYH